MRKSLLSFLVICVSLASKAQTWETVNIDSVVSCQVPKGYEKDTTNKKVSFIANSGFGTILIYKTDDNPHIIPDIEKDKHIKAYYNDYIKNIRSSAPGTIISNEKDTLISNLKVKDFKLQTDTGKGKQYRNFRIFHLNAATYTFEFLYNDIQAEYALPESDQFFKSIKADESLERKDQYTNNNNPKPGAENRRALLTGLIIGIGVLLIILYIFLRRKK